jgi:circadian clock protein KaiB
MPAPEINQTYVLKLYVTGQTPRSHRVISRVYQIAREWLDGTCEPIVIDVLEHPQLAEQDKILATPTLIRQSPPPVRRIIGDLADLDRVLQELGLTPEERKRNETNGAAVQEPNA